MHAMFDVHTVDMPRDMMLVPPRGHEREGDSESAVLQPQHHPG